MGFSTRQIHAGVEPDAETGSILTPIYQSTTFVQPSVDDYLSKGYSYSRSGNPTVRALERKLAVLEDGFDCTCYATGMAAIQVVFQACLNAGDHAIVSDVAYGGTYRLSTKVFARFGVEFSFVNTADAAEVEEAVKPNTGLILTETPANPNLKLTDIEAISEIARARNIPHAVDNTFLTPFYQRPLELGADISIHSTTKYFDGHNATVGGAVIAATEELDESIRFIQNASGVIMSPWVAWLTSPGHQDAVHPHGAAVGQRARHREIPGGAPKGHSGRLSGSAVIRPARSGQDARRPDSAPCSGSRFRAVSAQANGLWTRCACVRWPKTLGSVETLVTHPVTMTHADVEKAERERVGISDGLVRLSVGLEDVEDLIDDLSQALEHV